MHIIKTSLDNFSAAHRLIKGYVGKCQHLHGHDYSINVVFGNEKLNQYGFVVDFLEIKKHLNSWVQAQWDHATIVSEDDHALLNFLQKEQQKYYVLPNHDNSTAEVLAHHLFLQLKNVLFENAAVFGTAKLLQVEIWETKSSGAIYGEHQVMLHGEFCGKPQS